MADNTNTNISSSSIDNQTVHALELLNIGDLARAAGASKELVGDCCRIFSDKFSNTTIQIPLEEESSNCLKLVFKHFGHLITKMMVNYGAITKKKEISDKFVHQLIDKYCSESLQEFEIVEISSELRFDKKFPNLKTLMLDGGFLHESVLRFDEWCPRLEVIEYNSVENLSTIFNPQQTIPSLKSFTLNHSIRFADQKKTVSMSDVNSFIRLNPQLTELVLNVIENMTRSEKRFKQSDDVQFEPTSSPANPLSLKIMIVECPDGLKDLIVPFERVEHLDLFCDVLADADLLFIGKCCNMKTLKMKSTCDEFFLNEHWIRIAEKLTKLTTLSCRIARFFPVSNEDCEIVDRSLSGIRPFMILCRHLISIDFHCENEFNYCDEDDFEGDECDNVTDDLTKFEKEIQNEMAAWSLVCEAQIIEDTSVGYKYSLKK